MWKDGWIVDGGISLGLLLGAIRNGLPLPWDEDGDVSIMDTDYDRLFEVCDAKWTANGPVFWSWQQEAFTCDPLSTDRYLVQV